MHSSNRQFDRQIRGAHGEQRHGLQAATRIMGGIVAGLIYVACLSDAGAADYRSGYTGSHYYPGGYYGLHDNFGLQQDMGRLGDQMQRQQMQLQEQFRQQQEQTRLLRQQQSAQQQVTAMQACYYRFNGGLDVCDRLFDQTSKERLACIEAVIEMNPGCAADLANPEPGARE